VIKSHSRGFVPAKIGAEILLFAIKGFDCKEQFDFRKEKGLFSPLYL